MIIIPAIPVCTYFMGRKIKAFDSNAISCLFLSKKRFRGKSFIVGVTFADDSNSHHIISGFDTEEEAQKEVDNILMAIKTEKQVYRCVGSFDIVNRAAHKEEDEHE